jgi:glutamate racemase
VHIVITDSGVGGLSVCAYAERFVRLHGLSEPVRLTFANAAPENDYGYNSMPTRNEKIATFDRFLRNVTGRFSPDAIYVACNTLSVLLADTPFVASARIPVKGIVTTGVGVLLRELEQDPHSVAMIFGTQTTIDAGAYPRLLEERGIARSRIVSQACPGLADTISEDREGFRTRSEIRGWVSNAVEKLESTNAPVIAYLACTHYGYRRDHFAAAYEEMGLQARVVNPNERAVEDVFPGAGGGSHREAEVSFVTRYAIPPATVETLTYFLSGISPRTVAAMQHFVHLPDLF